MAELLPTRAQVHMETMETSTTFQFQLPPTPEPPREDQLLGDIHELLSGAVAEPVVPGTHPTFDNTQTFNNPLQSRTEIDVEIMSRIRRGREVGLRAERFDDVREVINAKRLYMEAISVLVPASRDLDIGPDSNLRDRLREKTKVLREASAMLDRCEALRSQIYASASHGRYIQRDVSNPLRRAPNIRHSNSRNLHPTSTISFNTNSSKSSSNVLPTRSAVTTEPKDMLRSRPKNLTNRSLGSHTGAPRCRSDTATSSASVSTSVRPSDLKSDNNFVTTSYGAAGMGISSTVPLRPSLPHNIYSSNVIRPECNRKMLFRNGTAPTPTYFPSVPVYSNQPAPKLPTVQKPRERKPETGPVVSNEERRMKSSSSQDADANILRSQTLPHLNNRQKTSVAQPSYALNNSPSVIPSQQSHISNPTFQSQLARRGPSAQVPTTKPTVFNSRTMRSNNEHLFTVLPGNKTAQDPQFSTQRNRGPGWDVDLERCVVCGDAASFRAPCRHGFCTKCGNRCVRVFGSCPVLYCNQILSLEKFEQMA